MPKFFLEAVDGGVMAAFAVGEVFVGTHQKQRQTGEAFHGFRLTAGDDEVVFAMSRRDKYFLACDAPLAAVVEFGFGGECSHI